MSGAETTRRRIVQRRIGGAEMALPPNKNVSGTQKHNLLTILLYLVVYFHKRIRLVI